MDTTSLAAGGTAASAMITSIDKRAG